MKREEKDFIANMPEKYRPKGAWALFWYSVLYSVPIIGQICLLVHAISDKNISRRSFARRYFCFAFLVAIVVAVLAVLFLVVFPDMGAQLMAMIKQFIEQFMQMIPKG